MGLIAQKRHERVNHGVDEDGDDDPRIPTAKETFMRERLIDCVRPTRLCPSGGKLRQTPQSLIPSRFNLSRGDVIKFTYTRGDVTILASRNPLANSVGKSSNKNL